jgi:hypothetical protein
MANPTTNYGFVLPTSTDLVTDLPADFDVALQGVDTRLKALQPGTTLGDLAYSSATANTNTRLAIGSTSQVLTVAGGVPTWAAPASGGMTLLSTTTLSGSSTTVSISPTGYNTLKFVITGVTAAGNGSFRLALNGDTNLADSVIASNQNGTFSTAGDLNWYISTYAAMLGSDANNSFQIQVENPASTAAYKNIHFSFGFKNSSSHNTAMSGGGQYKSNSAISSAVFSVFGTTFNGGTVLTYGVK